MRTEKCFPNFKTSFNVCKYFISLGLKSRTTSFSCSKNDDDFDEDFLLRTPLPWVVRVFFEYEESIKGILCSGETSTVPKGIFNTDKGKLSVLKFLFVLREIK